MEPGVLIEIARAVVPAAGIGVVGFGAAWLFRSSARAAQPAAGWRPEPGWLLAVAPVVFGLSVAATYPIISNQPPRLVPHSIADWLPHIALAALGIGILEAFVAAPRLIRLAARVALLATIATAVLWKSIPTWPVQTTLGWYALYILPTLVGWAALQSVADRARGSTIPWLILGWAGCASQTIIFTGSESLGRSVACLAAAAGGALLVSLIKPRFTMARGGCAVAAVVIPSILLVHAQTAPDEEVARLGPIAALLLLVPVLAAIVDEPAVCGLRGRARTAARVGVAAIPGLLAVALALSGVNLAEY